MTEELVDAVWTLLSSTNTSGRARYEQTQQEDAVVSLFLRMRIDLSMLQGPPRELLVRFLDRVFDGVDDRSDALASVERYFREHPVPPDLLNGMERIMRDPDVALAPEGDGGFAAFTGASPTNFQPQDADPTGIRSGPLARFLLNHPTKKKST